MLEHSKVHSWGFLTEIDQWVAFKLIIIKYVEQLFMNHIKNRMDISVDPDQYGYWNKCSN